MVMISGGAYDCTEVYDLRGLTDIEVATNIRHSVAQALATYYKVPQEFPLNFVSCCRALIGVGPPPEVRDTL